MVKSLEKIFAVLTWIPGFALCWDATSLSSNSLIVPVYTGAKYLLSTVKHGQNEVKTLQEGVKSFFLLNKRHHNFDNCFTKIAHLLRKKYYGQNKSLDNS